MKIKIKIRLDEASELKQKVALALKPFLKKYGVVATVSSGRGGMTEVIYITLKSGPFKFDNVHSYIQHKLHSGDADAKEVKFINELIDIIEKAGGYYDNSDSMHDYFDVAFIYAIRKGTYDKPYKYTGD